MVIRHKLCDLAFISELRRAQPVRRAPELAAVMSEARAWWWDRKGEIPPGKLGFYEMPVFNFFQVSS